MSCDLFWGFVSDRGYKLTKTVLGKIDIQIEVRHLNYTLNFVGGPLWVEGFFGTYQHMLSLPAFIYVYILLYKHTYIHTYNCSKRWADPQNGINNTSTLFDMDYWNFYSSILTTELKNTETLHVILGNVICYNHKTSLYMTLQWTVGY